VRTETCWNWSGSVNRGGYGVVTVGGRSGKKLYAHRIAYELYLGPIPHGLDIDHLCRNRRCANPSHLEAVTRRINIVRGIGPKILGSLNANKTHCSNGHPFNEKNTVHRIDGGRRCRACDQSRRSKLGSLSRATGETR
jgi:hypothetical protein